jgi:hypothetical protein
MGFARAQPILRAHLGFLERGLAGAGVLGADEIGPPWERQYSQEFNIHLADAPAVGLRIVGAADLY